MTQATARAPMFLVAAAALALTVGVSACDDDPPSEKKADQPRGVLGGAKAESEAGKKLEQAQERIDEVEDKLEKRDDRVFEESQGERVERGVPSR